MRVKTTKTDVQKWVRIGAAVVLGGFILANLTGVVKITTLFGSVQVSATTGMDRLNEIKGELEEVESKIKEYENKANELAAQADTLNNKIAQLQAEASALTELIKKSQIELEKVTEEIKVTEQRIQDNRDALGKIMVDKYMNEKVSLVERLASSKNLSDFIDEEAKMSSVSDSLSQRVQEIKADKARLEGQRREVERLIEAQKSQKKMLEDAQGEQQRILDETQGQEAAYQSMRSDADGRRMELMQEQKKIMDELLAGHNVANRPPGGMAVRNYSGELGCTGGYSYCDGGLDYTVDEWRLYARECVSYAAWAMEYRFGKDVRSFQGRGNANQWPDSAPALMGARTDNIPEVGSVAIWYVGVYGHAMVVEQILNDGWIKVSQYNYAVNGQYSTMEIPSDAVVYIHFINK